MKYVVKYTGSFGFIKPAQAFGVEILTETFLTPAQIRGICRSLEIEDWETVRAKVDFKSIVWEFQPTQLLNTAIYWNRVVNYAHSTTLAKNGIITRGTMVEPVLYLMFEDFHDAEKASNQTVRLCRNEDLMFPESLEEITVSEFEEIQGFEFVADENGEIFGGFDRKTGEIQRGSLRVNY